VNLFSELEDALHVVPEGLVYRPNFLSLEDERRLLEWIETQPWATELSRRRQFYGGGYGEDRSSVPEKVEPLPEPLFGLASRLHWEGLFEQVPDQALINEYLPGQGIASHVDHHPRFQQQVAMISLADEYPMRFARVGGTGEYEQWLAMRSVCVISGPARYEWTHEIAKRKADVIDGGGKRLRGRRVSVTFRKWSL